MAFNFADSPHLTRLFGELGVEVRPVDMHIRRPCFSVKGGTKAYIEKLIPPFKNKIRLGAAVRKVKKLPDQIKIALTDGSEESFDKVILACHADQALEILDLPSAAEENLLSHFKYQSSSAILHTDPSVMPKNLSAWASTSVHYWLNSLQGLSCKTNYFLSLNYETVNPASIVRRIVFKHLPFGPNALEAQKNLHALNRRRDIRAFFCGGYFGQGLHEDAFTSALELSRILLDKPLWL